MFSLYYFSIMKILVGSKNPVKINSVKEAFSNYFENITVEGIDVESGVSNQPFGNDTYAGAQNRALKLLDFDSKNKLGGDYFVGIEGGVSKQFDRWFAFGCMCIINKKGNIGFGNSPAFELPEMIVNKLIEGAELGDVMDEIMNERNTKQRGGAIGFFTNGVMNRKELYVEGLKVAIIPFLHEDMFFSK